VGPWLDAYFSQILINSISNPELDIKFIVRIEDGVIDKKTLSAINLTYQNIKNVQARSMENLHSKIILIDGEVFFLGSANWYWYSLNKGVEVTVKGSIDILPDLTTEVNKYWKAGTNIKTEIIAKNVDFKQRKKDFSI
jgi:hypothetical protein